MPEYTSEQLLEIVNQDDGLPGNPRVKQIARRIVTDLFRTIEDLDIHSEEFWAESDGSTNSVEPANSA
jgi:catechol 1,2-dioxygenase